MSRHAGFAIVASLLESAANDYLRIYVANNIPPQTFTLPDLVTVGGISVSISGSVALLPPEVTFSQNSANLVTVNLALAGSLSLAASTLDSATVEAILYTTLQVPLSTPIVDGLIKPSIDLSGITVSTLGVEVLAGSPLAPLFNQALTSPTVLNAMTAQLRTVPASSLPINPSPISTNISFQQERSPPKGTSEFGPFPTWFSVNLTVSRVTYCLFDGAVTIAADIADYTSGDSSQLVNLFTANGPGSYVLVDSPDGSRWTGTPGGPHSADIAILINAAIVSGVVSQISSAVSGTLIDDHVEIRDLSVSLGYFTTDLYGDGYGATFVADVRYDTSTHRLDDGFGYFAPDDDSINISATATFHMEYYLSTRDGDTDWVSQGKDSWQPRIVDSNISLPAWLDVALVAGSIVLPGLIFPPLLLLAQITPLVTQSELSSLLDNAANQAVNGLGPALGGAAIVSQSVGPLPQTTNPQWLSIISGIALSSDGIDSYLTYSKVNWPTLSISPDADPDGTENGYIWSVFDANPIVIWLAIDVGNYRADDPSIFANWVVTRTDTNETVLQETQAWSSMAGKPIISIDHSSKALAASPGFTVSCSCYRLLGYRVDQIFSGTLNITIQDFLDRHHPYVSWRTAPFIVPGYPKASIGAVAESTAGETVQYWSRTRQSRIHRTDYPGRCIALGPSAPPGRIAGYIYSDSLPFPVEQADQNRHGVLCDYCFYGGPTKTTLLI